MTNKITKFEIKKNKQYIWSIPEATRENIEQFARAIKRFPNIIITNAKIRIVETNQKRGTTHENRTRNQTKNENTQTHIRPINTR